MIAVKTEEFVKNVLIKQFGYDELKHINGGHRNFIAENKPKVQIPRHKVLSPGVQREILKRIGVC